MKVGILGAGQLSRMLCEAAQGLGLESWVWSHQASEPAALVSDQLVLVGASPEASLGEFFKSVDRVTFESEFVPTAALDLLKNLKSKPPHFAEPGVDVLLLLRDKLEQKKCYRKLGIPTPEFLVYQEGDLEAWLKSVLHQFGDGAVLKWSLGGYDGKGVFFFSHLSEMTQAKVFCESALTTGARVYGEEKIKFERELAIVSTHSITDELYHYPIMNSVQKNGICLEVSGPAIELGVLTRAREREIQEIARTIAEEIQIFGTFAVELLATQDGRVLVNEMAPRVHNSGHFTQVGFKASQFENHWRGILGYPLQTDFEKGIYWMRNLLGPGVFDVPSSEDVLNASSVFSPSMHFYWYDKKECRSGRKMGHVNFFSSDMADAKQRLKEVRTQEDQFWKALRKDL